MFMLGHVGIVRNLVFVSGMSSWISYSVISDLEYIIGSMVTSALTMDVTAFSKILVNPSDYKTL
jgi:hypothetical protein